MCTVVSYTPQAVGLLELENYHVRERVELKTFPAECDYDMGSRRVGFFQSVFSYPGKCCWSWGLS